MPTRNENRSRARAGNRVAVAATAFCLIAGTTAIAGASGAPGEKNANASVAKLAKQLKKLKQQVASISKQQGPAGPQGPAGAQGAQGAQGPADGPAGGDLTGSYPNPDIAGGAVGSGELGTNAVTQDTTGLSLATGNFTTKVGAGAIGTGEIGDNTVGKSDIASDGVGGSELDLYEVEEDVVVNDAAADGTESTGGTTPDCNAGDVPISGGGFWTVFLADQDLTIGTSTRTSGGWSLVVGNDTGTSKTFRGFVLCADV